MEQNFSDIRENVCVFLVCMLARHTLQNLIIWKSSASFLCIYERADEWGWWHSGRRQTMRRDKRQTHLLSTVVFCYVSFTYTCGDSFLNVFTPFEILARAFQSDKTEKNTRLVAIVASYYGASVISLSLWHQPNHFSMRTYDDGI